MIIRAEHKGQGIAIGKAFVYIRNLKFPAKSEETNVDERSNSQKLIFTSAISTLISDIENELSSSEGPSAEILEAHLEMAKDELLEQTALEHISEGMTALEAVFLSRDEIVEMLSQTDDEYLKARCDDVKDICSRLINIITGNSKQNPFENISNGTVVIADELFPSDTSLIDFSKVVAIVTQSGSPTSHVSIIAKSKGVPAIVGIRGILECVTTEDEVIVDAENGQVITEADADTLARYRELARQINDTHTILRERALEKAVTQDGTPIKVYANAANLEEIKQALLQGAEGIGLLRTEFLYLGKTQLPTEEELCTSFIDALKILDGKPLTIRALDIGGDKQIPHIVLPKEENPFLGCRGIRFLLTHTDVFKTQIRAVLRASNMGKIRFMLPMVCTEQEIDMSKKLIENCRKELLYEGIPQGEISLGIMIETPAAVFIADTLSKKVEFFSIGTNDLTQYIMAADRGNSQLAYLLDTSNPALTSAISMILLAGKNNSIEVGMCGEYASNPESTEKLIRFGLKEFSVSPAAIPELKDRIRKINLI